jgi:hypothetical protein
MRHTRTRTRRGARVTIPAGRLRIAPAAYWLLLFLARPLLEAGGSDTRNCGRAPERRAWGSPPRRSITVFAVAIATRLLALATFG